MRHVADVVFVLCWLGLATVCVFRPVIMARWVKQAHPSLDENDRTILWFIRILGIGNLALSLALSVVIIRSFGG